MRKKILLFVMATLTACAEADDKAATDDVEVAPIIIYASPVRDEEVIDPILATGEVRADKRTDIKPRVNGIIDIIHVRVGDAVKKGQPLFETRKIEYSNRVRELEHALVLARAEVDQAKRDMTRAQTLRAKGVVSQGRMDTMITQNATAEARKGIAEASLARAQQDLSDTIVRAPYDGIITSRFVDEGTMVQVAAANTPVVELVKVDIVDIIAQVPATHLSRIRQGSRADVVIDGLADPIPAILDVINDKVDARTRSVEVRLRVKNPDHKIKPGLFAKVTLYPEPRQATVIERRALLGIAGDNYVFTPEAGVARRRSVQARDIDAERVEILAGLDAGETALVGPNLPEVQDGKPIAVQDAGIVPVVYDQTDEKAPENATR